MKSNADVYIVMIGTNDDRKNPFHPEGWKDRLILWNDTKSIDKFVNTYVDLGNQIKALPQKPQVFIVLPPPLAERCYKPES